MQINQLPAAASLNLQDKFAVDATDGVTKSITAAKLRDLIRANSYGAPLEASTVATMTDTSKVYVYTGNETGYTNGNWYYYDGTAWVSGGVYNSVAVNTDTTLTLSGVAADARATGTAIQGVATQVTSVEGDLQQEIDNIFSDLATAYEALAFPVSEGQYCVRAERVYKANQDIPTPEAWNSSHWTLTSLGEGLSDLGDVPADIATVKAAIVTERLARQTADTSLNNAISAEATAREAADNDIKSAVDTYSTYPISNYFYNKQTDTHNGVTYSWGADGKCTVTTVTGGATSTSVNNLYASETALPPGIEVGKPYILNYKTSDPNVKLSIACFTGNTPIYYSYQQRSMFMVPAGTVGMSIRLYVASGVSFATPAIVSCVDILSVDSLIESFHTVKRALMKYNAVNLLAGGNYINGSSNGVTFSWNEDMTICTANGTNTGSIASLNTIFSGQTRLPDGVIAGNEYYLKMKTSSANLRVRMYCYKNGAYVSTIERNSDSKIKIPDDVTGLSVYVCVPVGATVSNATIEDIALLAAETNDELTRNSLKQYEPTGSSFSVFADMPDMSYWIGQKSYIENGITGDVVSLVAGWSYFVYKIKQLVCIVSPAADQFYCGQIRLSDNYQYWSDLTKTAGDVYNNYYTTEHYDNTYNITCSPSITTDTNNYLASTGDTTDRTGDIQTMLNTNHICRLGPGVFYVTGIDVPNLSMLIGCGTATRLILSPSVTNGYAVKLNSYSQLKDIYVKGNASYITPTDPLSTGNPVNNRHGVLFEATANAENPTFFYRSKIEGCTITDFEYGGITCYNTGLNPGCSLCVVNCQIARCGAGVNLQYFTEFHRFTNIASQDCYYGCIDNGGNNNFTNCDFSMNKLALLIDNSTDQSRNNTHGTFSACSFHHSDNVYSGGVPVSVGTAIKILKASAGEIFSGCQIGYGDIEIDRSVGIRFVGCNIISKVAMRITDSPLVTFSDCTFLDTTNNPLTESGNTRLTYDNCYTRLGAAFDPMA